jgi:hypothetical protein
MSAAGFGRELRSFSVKAERVTRATFVRCTTEVQRSLVEGSPLTGAPGQPVDTGTLRASFIPRFNSLTDWQITTPLVYAPYIEDGVRPDGVTLSLRSVVGGFHSAKLTRAGWPQIVKAAALASGGGA